MLRLLGSWLVVLLLLLLLCVLLLLLLCYVLWRLSVLSGEGQWRPRLLLFVDGRRSNARWRDELRTGAGYEATAS